jgi:hypothetical protein
MHISMHSGVRLGNAAFRAKSVGNALLERMDTLIRESDCQIRPSSMSAGTPSFCMPK